MAETKPLLFSLRFLRSSGASSCRLSPTIFSGMRHPRRLRCADSISAPRENLRRKHGPSRLTGPNLAPRWPANLFTSGCIDADFKHHLRTPDVEWTLDEMVLDALKQARTSGRISFSEPDMVIVIDTVDDRAGVALWTHEELARHKLLRPD